MTGIKPWRRRGLATVAALALTVGAAGGPASASAYPGEAAAEAPNRIAAEADAQNLLAQLVLPAGSTYSATQPQGSSPQLSKPFTLPGTPKLIDLPGWWSVPGSPPALLESIKQHPPAGAHMSGEGSSAQLGVGETSHSIELSWPPVAGVLSSRALLITAVAEPGGKTGLRADAQVIWIVPRPKSERIPSRARVLDVEYSGGEKPRRELRVLSRRAVRRIASLIDRLPIVQPDIRYCPVMQANPRTVSLTFRAAPTGRALAKATQAVPPGYCSSMGIEIRGTEQPALAGGGPVLRALSAWRRAGS